LIIHVVKPGDSLWAIAKLYGVSINSIIQANGSIGFPLLVIGEALIIPNEISYRVKPGDSLLSIASNFKVSVDNIRNINNIPSNNVLSPGIVIKIPKNAKQYGFIEVNAFITPSTKEKESVAIKETQYSLTYIAPFSYHVQENGTLIPINDEFIIEQARQNSIAPMLSVTNLGTSNFDTDLIHKILSTESIQQTLINNIMALLKAKKYYGVIIDFEKISPADRDLYNNFLRKITAQLHKEKYVVATALAPKTSDIKEGSWHGAHDYKAHGEIVDFVIIMTYEWGWSGGPPMAVAPINEVRKVIQYAVSVMPPKKIIMGIPFYGYDWTLPYLPKGEFAKSIGNEEAVKIAIAHKTMIKYDIKAQSPYFNYMDTDRAAHVVWFEDARSIKAKFNLASSFNLRGVSYWALGKPFTQNWTVLNDMFNVVKVI
jgi:spore germination protein